MVLTKQKNIWLLTVLLNRVNTFSLLGFISISLSFKNKTYPLCTLTIKTASCSTAGQNLSWVTVSTVVMTWTDSLPHVWSRKGVVHWMGAVTETTSGKMIRKLIALLESLENSSELSTEIFCLLRCNWPSVVYLGMSGSLGQLFLFKDASGATYFASDHSVYHCFKKN